MTSDTIRKRAERLRKKEAGYKRVEVWMRDRDIDRLGGFGPTPSEAIVMLLDVEDIHAKRRALARGAHYAKVNADSGVF